METLEEFIKKHQRNKEKTSSFVEYLYHLMNKYSIDNPSDIYNKANISRQLWSSIISEKSHPSLNVCIKTTPVAFLSPNNEIALSTRFCKFRKQTILPNVLMLLRIRLVREKA